MSLLTLEWREDSGEKLGESSLTYLPQCVRFLSRRACRSRSAAISAARVVDLRPTDLKFCASSLLAQS